MPKNGAAVNVTKKAHCLVLLLAHLLTSLLPHPFSGPPFLTPTTDADDNESGSIVCLIPASDEAVDRISPSADSSFFTFFPAIAALCATDFCSGTVFLRAQRMVPGIRVIVSQSGRADSLPLRIFDMTRSTGKRLQTPAICSRMLASSPASA